MFITVGGIRRVAEAAAYLYKGQSIVAEVETQFGTYIVVDTGTDEHYRSEYLRDRFASGMFGAKLFATRAEADAYIETWKVVGW